MAKPVRKRKGASRRETSADRWRTLLRQLDVAESIQREAIANFADAERRLFALRPLGQRRRPNWYVIASRAVARSGDCVDRLYGQIAATPAYGKAGMRAKIRLLACVSAVPLAEPVSIGEKDDLPSQLIRSLAADLGAHGKR